MDFSFGTTNSINTNRMVTFHMYIFYCTVKVYCGKIYSIDFGYNVKMFFEFVTTSVG